MKRLLVRDVKEETTHIADPQEAGRTKCNEQIDSDRQIFFEQVWPFGWDGTEPEDQSDSMVTCEACKPHL